MTNEEIATWTGAPLGTIKGRIRLGLEKLRGGLVQSGASQADPVPARAAPRGVRAPVAELEPAPRRRTGPVFAPRAMTRRPAA
jgi:hypothetical protein